MADLLSQIQQTLRQYPDFPEKGILFQDIFPLFRDPKLIDALVQYLADRVSQHGHVDVIVGLDARGFLFGPLLAIKLGCSFVPVRKKGKLPGQTITVGYKKEYGTDYFDIQADAISAGQKVVVIDDLIATGGSAKAAGDLVRKCGGTVLEYLFIVELVDLNGKDQLLSVNPAENGNVAPQVYSLVKC